MNNNSNPRKGHPKDSDNSTLKRKILTAFYDRPKTRRMVHEQDGFYSGTICGAVSQLIKEGRLKIVKIDTCEHSGRRNCQYLSSNPKYINPQTSQR